MRIPTGLIAGISLLAATAMPAALGAEAKIYAYPSSANYCPAGLQPVTIGGVICCGTPNQGMTYQHMMAHPAGKRHAVRSRTPKSADYDCPIGVKGC